MHQNNKAMIKRQLFLIQFLILSLLTFSQGMRQQVKSPDIVVDTFPIIYNMISMVDTDTVVSMLRNSKLQKAASHPGTELDQRTF
jgi:hypothetical protein